MIKISHEVPFCMLKESKKFNDYDYALVHLFEENKEYYNFYVESLKQGRHVLLDNSLFELGEAFDEKAFAYWVKKLKPTEYIIPDSWENTDQTIANLESWMKTYGGLPGKKIGVCHGKTYKELVRCYKALDKSCDKIAISFGYSYYEKSFSHSSKFVSLALGRVKLIGDLLKDNIINKNKPHHLLGNALPIEGKFYDKYNWIQTMDSSNPIVHAIKGKKYEPNFGLYTKEPQKLHELINFPLEKIDLELVMYNINEFQRYWKKDNFC
jgi:hypothetical protein